MAYAVLLTVLLLSKITVYSDDYYFGTFFHDGFSGFLEKTLDHFQNSNGRMLVHFLLEVALLFDTKLYVVLCPLLLVAAVYFGSRLVFPQADLGEILFAMAAALLLIIGMGVELLRSSLLWMAGSFGFILPVTLLLAAFYQGAKVWEQDKWSPPGLILAFLAGATTEQYGLIALVFFTGMALFRRGEKRQKKLHTFAFPVFTLAGYLTVLLAPGTHSRINGEGLSLSDLFDPTIFAKQFSEIMNCSLGVDGCMTVAVLFIATTTFLIFITKKYKGLYAPGFFVLPVVIFLYKLEHYSGCYVITVAYLFYIAGVFLVTERKEAGLLTLGAVLSQAMMMISTTFGPRTAMPFLLILVILSTVFLAELTRMSGPWLYPLFFAGIALWSWHSYEPLYQGYAANKMIIDRNIDAIDRANAKGEAVICTDWDKTYCYTMMNAGNYFFTHFRQYYQLNDDVKIYFENSNDVNLYIRGERTTYQAFIVDGVPYFQLEDAIRILGGTIKFTESSIMISYQGNPLVLPKEEGGIYDIARRYDNYYINGNTFRDLLGLTLVYDEQHNAYIIT